MPAVPPDVFVSPPSTPGHGATGGSHATTSVAVKDRSPWPPVLAAAAALAVAGVALVVATDRSDRAVPEREPTEVVREYFGAFRSGDCEAAVDLVDTDGHPGEPARTEAVEACRQAHDAEPGIENAELLSADLTTSEGDRATVRTEIREGDQLLPSEPDDVPLVRIGGEWKIDLGEVDADEGPATTAAAPDDPADQVSADATGGGPAP